MVAVTATRDQYSFVPLVIITLLALAVRDVYSPVDVNYPLHTSKPEFRLYSTIFIVFLLQILEKISKR